MATTSSIPPLSSRPYELILFGATGYTGKLCAEHITTHLPTDLTWAVSGRSSSKLQSVVNEIRSLNPDRKQPAIEECALEPDQLAALARKTKVLVNCVGPYSLYGEQVVKACAENGTSYVDTTGEVPWVLKMIRKYHEIAKATGAVIIPQCGFESCASDLLVFHTLHTLSTLSPPASASHVTGTVHRVRGSASGGTLATIFTLFDVFSTSELLESQKPFALSPIQRSSSASAPTSHPKSILSKLTGTHFDPALGPLTSWPMGAANAAIVQRSWGLHTQAQNLAGDSKLYGPKFTYDEYASVRNRALGIAVNVALAGLVVFLALPPVRWVARRLVTQAGQGPTKETAAKEGFEFRCVADADDESERRVLGKMEWKGGIYEVTAVYMMEAAGSLVRDETGLKEKLGGGVLTPACLGTGFVERLRKAGVGLDAEAL